MRWGMVSYSNMGHCEASLDLSHNVNPIISDPRAGRPSGKAKNYAVIITRS